MTDPLVSVAIPSYNHEAFIKDALTSVLNQSDVALEVLVVDDASTDRTADIAIEIAKTDPRVRVFQNPENRGPSYSSQVFIKEARGQYICPLPSDDIFVEGKLQKQIDLLNANPNMALVYTDALFIDETGAEISHTNHYAAHNFDVTPRSRTDWLKRFFFKGNCVCASGILVRADLFKQFKPDLRLLQLQDYDCWLRMVLAGYDLGVVPEKLIKYRILSNHGNLSAPSPEAIKRDLYEKAKVLENFHSLSSLEDLQAMGIDANCPENVSEQLSIQHHLAQAAWNLKSLPHRHFAVETWYKLLGQENDPSQLKDMGLDMRFLASRTVQSPLVYTCNNTYSNIPRRLVKSILPQSIYTKLSKYYKKLGANK